MRNKRILALLAWLILLSCDSAQVESTASETDVACTPQEDGDFMTVPSDGGYCQPAVWVCHNPGSKLHNQACTDDCMVHGDNSTYCWLRESQCEIGENKR